MILGLALVIAITDGDTIKVLDASNVQHKVRLASIDAPERKQPYGTKSKQELASLVGKRRVTLDCPSVDRYKRLICTVWSGGEDVNRLMVDRGAAWVYRQYYKGTDYYEAEKAAQSQQRGLWKTSEYQAMPPWEWRKAKRQK
ncbi:thermonuclease family protein [Neptunomonas qingdaonensis]|uniref:Endonuclease YncB, thermonuclease family n=1 Tax=Neptunomonas qingdaonensis TaxID=1045558 RepID=A0A1I2Q998_9GAMM|nr:Endonuclease YncB, thermonuclease family [Neptunomonas qingdaonensis]